MIVRDGSKWLVKSKDGTKVLATCDTEAEAKKRMGEIEAFKAKGDGAATRVTRFDLGELREPVKTAYGFLRVDGRLTRTGVFTYLNGDGTKRRELRLPEEVFAQDSLESFAMMPVTDGHPGLLTAANAAEHQRGSVGEQVRRDGDYVVASLMVTDSGLIRAMEDGSKRQLSCGYECDLEPAPAGAKYDGQPYDVVQRRIKGNHVAVLEKGRAGAEARVRMDSGAAQMVSVEDEGGDDSPQHTPEAHVKLIHIDGVGYEAGSEQAAKAQADLQTKLDAEAKTRLDADRKAGEDLKVAKEDLAKANARADAEAEKVKRLDGELKALPAKVTADLKTRMDLEAKARGVLGENTKLDGLDDKAVKVAVLKKVSPDLKLDGKEPAYIDARFDMAIEAHAVEDGEEREDALDAARRAAEGGGSHEDLEPVDADKAHAKMQKANRDAWKNAGAKS